VSERRVFRTLIQIEDAWSTFIENVRKEVADQESVVLSSALNRVLAVDIYSGINVPPFDRVLMDGYAVNSNEIESALENNPVSLRLIGGIKAGHIFEGSADTKTCVEVSTGSPVPYGYDSVVMIEYTEREGDIVKLYRPTSPSENIMSAGADIRYGELILRARTTLTPRDLAILAALGMTEVQVLRKPRIGIFSSGDEIVELGKPLEPGKIYDINATMIESSVLENGGHPEYLGILSDTYEEIYQGVENNLGNFDLLIISGGTSAGMGDVLYKVVEDIGDPGLLVHGIKVKPGKPTILASCHDTPIIGLPGNPSSALSIVHLFVIRYIRLLANLDPIPPESIVVAQIRQKLRSTPGRHEFKPVNIVSIEGTNIAFPVPGGSGAITSIGLADGFIQIPEGVSFLSPGDTVEVSLLSKSTRPVDLQIIGEYDVLLNRILQIYTQSHPQVRVRFIPTSSSGGKMSLKHGECHLASIESVESPGENTILSYKRTFGILFRKGLPIHSVLDLTAFKMINYPLNSSLRKIVDEVVDSSNDGYNAITKTVYSAISLILQNKIDFCMGLEVDLINGLDFLTVGEHTFSIIRSETNSHFIDEFQEFAQSLDLPSIMQKGYHK